MIDNFLTALPKWQQDNLIIFRKLISEIAPDITEDLKWGVPVFLVNGKVIFAMSGFKEHTKYNFFNGALLDDKNGLFNNGLESKKSRGIDLRENDKVNLDNLKSLAEESIKLVR